MPNNITTGTVTCQSVCNDTQCTVKCPYPDQNKQTNLHVDPPAPVTPPTPNNCHPQTPVVTNNCGGNSQTPTRQDDGWKDEKGIWGIVMMVVVIAIIVVVIAFIAKVAKKGGKHGYGYDDRRRDDYRSSSSSSGYSSSSSYGMDMMQKHHHHGTNPWTIVGWFFVIIVGIWLVGAVVGVSHLRK